MEPARPDVVVLTNGTFVENCYLVADRATGEAVVVDPGEEADLFLARLHSEEWRATAIWLTHAHIDHIAGVGRVKDVTGVPVFLHPLDRRLYDAAPLQAAAFGLQVDPPPPPDAELAEGQTLRVGSWSFEVMHLPGHAPGHVAFVGHGLALAGDVLFQGSIGRTDLPGGDTRTLLDSIRGKLFTLPNDTMVLPGHGPPTTIGAEKLANPFVKLQPGINACLRCGAEVLAKPRGCKGPCANCGFVYPLGDCSD